VIGNNSQAFQPMWLGDAAQPATGTSLLYERVQTSVNKMLLDLSSLSLFVKSTDSDYQCAHHGLID
jgi:hypothetical protein